MSSRPDVLVIGGGVMGCAVAWRLAQAGVSVTVLERALPGAEASTKAAGMLAVQGEADEVGPFLDLCLASRARWGDFAGEVGSASGVDVALSLRGILYPIGAADEVDAMRSRAAWQRAQGMAVEVVTGAEMRALEPSLSEELEAGLFAPADGQVSPPLLNRALHRAAEAAGVIFRCGVVAASVEVCDGRAHGVRDTEGRTMSAGAVVVAGGAWTSLLDGVGIPEGAVQPARGQLMALRAARPVVKRPVFMGGLGYALPTPDGRTLVGSTMERVGFERAVTLQGVDHMGNVARRLVPALKDAAVEDVWCGFRPWTPDELPLMGPCETAGLHVAAGHFRSGILLAPITGEAVAQAVLGEATAVDLAPFLPGRLSLP